MRKLVYLLKQLLITRQTSLLLMLLLCFSWQQDVQGQNCTGNIILDTQADVKAFGPCTSFTGSITITSQFVPLFGFVDPITDLSPLAGLNEIDGNLKIFLVFLPNLNGLSGLESVNGNLEIAGNPELTSLSGLIKLHTVGGNFAITGNPGLTSLTGLSGLTSVGKSLAVKGNPKITSLSGLGSLTKTGENMAISDNAMMTSLSGLTALSSVGGDLTISNNPTLSSLAGPSNLTSVGGAFILDNNDMLTNPGVLQFSFQGAYITENDQLLNVDALSGLTTLDGGSILISKNPKLENVDGLKNITSMIVKPPPPGCNFFCIPQLPAVVIQQNSSLKNVDGLMGLTTLTGIIHIIGNAALENVDGLRNVTSVASGYINNPAQLYIQANAALNNINGLQNLTTIDQSAGLSISFNPKLTNVNGLGALTTLAGFLEISENSSLTTLDGLERITSVSGGLGVYSNSKLSDCCGIYDLINGLNNKSVTGFISIRDNATGCDSEAEIDTNCKDADGDGVTITDGDCDDMDRNEFPGQKWYIDADGDNFGGSSTTSCERPTNGFVLAELSGTGTDDCDDTDGNEFPGQTWYIDADGDNFGGSTTTACERPAKGFLPAELSGTDDCDDMDSNEFPGQTWYIDADGDNFGGSTTTSCERPAKGFLLAELSGSGTDDCDDTDLNVNPGMVEILCNGIDDDCDPSTPDGNGDDDCDGVFNECDICPGGDDSIDANEDGIPDCSQLLDYNEYSPDWYCGKNRLYISHPDEDGVYQTLCINKKALQDHWSHGDWVGPYQACSEDLTAPIGSGITTTDHISLQEMKIFPNPARHKVDIFFERNASTATLKITDILGRVVYTNELTGGIKSVSIQLDRNAFTNGVYLVSLYENGQLITKQLLVQE